MPSNEPRQADLIKYIKKTSHFIFPIAVFFVIKAISDACVCPCLCFMNHGAHYLQRKNLLTEIINAKTFPFAIIML